MPTARLPARRPGPAQQAVSQCHPAPIPSLRKEAMGVEISKVANLLKSLDSEASSE